ncbi:MAG TPA: phosphate ABC transporter substrate-binding protein, partial [Thermodesulfobacteriota bacterium]|nr:phosphate ABC transporter substrate-binding protein [Thermodesulfobacteriota bacterium]
MQRPRKTCLRTMGLVALGILVSSIMCTRPSAFAGSMTIKGSTTVLPIAQVTAEVFMEKHPDADISVQGGGSGVGIAALIDGTCDIADSSRPMKDQEVSLAVSKGRDPKVHVVAMDGIAVIVHSSNQLANISKGQLKDIYTGKISDWSGLGAGSGKIVVISRDSASGTFESFGEMALDKERVRSDALMQASNQAIASMVERTPGAIGYVGLGYITPKVKALSVDGIIPTNETVLASKYRLSRPLFMYTNGTPAGVVKQYIEFVASPEGQA